MYLEAITLRGRGERGKGNREREGGREGEEGAREGYIASENDIGYKRKTNL